MLSRTTRVLLIVAVIAVAAYFLINRTSREPEPDSNRLADFDPARVNQIVLAREADTLRFVLGDSVWRMTEPVRDRAEPATIVSLLSALENAQVERDLGASGDLAQFGLEPPQVVVIALARADTLVHVKLGKRTVDDAWCYARVGTSSSLLLVPTDIARAASLPRDAYRNQRVIDFQLRDVAWFTMSDFRNADPRNSGSDVRSMRWIRKDGGWLGRITARDSVPGDSVAVEAVLRRLRGLRVSSFVVEYDHWRTLATIEIFRKTSPIASLHFEETEVGTVVVDNLNGRKVLVTDDLEDLFDQSITSLRDRRLLQFSPPDADRIEVVLPDAQGGIVRTGGVWSFPNPAMGRIDPERAADFVRALRALKWTDVAPATSLDDARFSITVTGAGGTILDQMRAAPGPDGSLLVTSQSTRETRRIDREPLTTLAATFARLKTP